jgi:hypothetical protein
LRDSTFSIAVLVIALLAYFIRTSWVQISLAAAIAMLATYYAIITCNVVAA